MTDERKLLIVDIDGTIADAEGRRGPFDYHLVHHDAPILPVLDVVRAMWVLGYRVVFLTGREESCRELTVDWIGRHVTHLQNESLYMRPNGDRSSGSTLKRSLYERIVEELGIVRSDRVIAVEDQPRIAAMWREIGVTCLLVDDNDFGGLADAVGAEQRLPDATGMGPVS